MISLRNRAVAGAVFWASVIIAVGSYFMSDYLSQQTQRWFDDQLAVKHSKVVLALANNADAPDAFAAAISNAAYQRPFSGDYWQVEQGRDVFTSPSLADFTLSRVFPVSRRLTFEQFAGPDGQTLRVAQQQIELEDGSVWYVRVGSSTAALERDREALGQRLSYGFVIIGLFGTLGAMLLVIATLRPLSKLREDVNRRWDSEDGLEVDGYPVEVRPLVEDINDLMGRNKEVVDRSRRQTADLAHALKTPAAIMRNELEKLQMEGAEVSASLDALNRLDAQLQRSLARMRAMRSGSVEHAPAEVSAVLNRMARAFSALARSKERAFQFDIAEDLHLRIDVHDLEEICGNILDNALKWSNDTFRMTAKRSGQQIVIQVSDDGPGIPEAFRKDILKGGLRLDETTPGTGLGLSIASDLVAAYGGAFEISESPTLGGAAMVVSFKT